VIGARGAELHRSADPRRDQSYFLFATTPEQLDYLRFPLGDLPKTETRAIAAAFELAVADKPDSQDICFVPNGGYAAVVERLRPGAAEPGELVHLDGRVLGRHDGVINFTVGQRKGLGLGDLNENGQPLYVVRLEPETRRVFVGPKAALARSNVTLREVNWLGRAGEPMENVAVEVKLRSMSEPKPAIISLLPGGYARVALEEPQFGVAPGQACVFYRASRVLGGGWIERGRATMAA
jgi:tRNA-specific 2-thiouridylase